MSGILKDFLVKFKQTGMTLETLCQQNPSNDANGKNPAGFRMADKGNNNNSNKVR